MNWKKKKIKQGCGYEDIWENPLGDVVHVEQRQDRDGKNPFMFTAVETNRSAIGTARGKRKVLAKGRNQEKLMKKLREMLK